MSIRSTEHERCPPKRNKVRAETYTSGYIIRPTESGCSLFLVAQNDIKGLLPKFIVNREAGRVPPKWIDDLKKACMKSPIPQYEMDAWASLFRRHEPALPSRTGGHSSSSSKQMERETAQSDFAAKTITSLQSEEPDAFDHRPSMAICYVFSNSKLELIFYNF